MHQFDFVTFGRIDKRKAAPVVFKVRAVGIVDVEFGEFGGEFV